MQDLKLNLEESRSGGAYPAVAFEPATDAERRLILAAASLPETDHHANLAGDKLYIRRTLDIVLSLILIVILTPLLVVITLAIVLCDPGPPFFAHYRIGKEGRPFRCLKFRSMCVDAQARLQKMLHEDAGLKAEWDRGYKLSSDPRVTRLGQALRVSSLDELPQLFNVLWGNMTLVGPRPIVSAELCQYGRFAPYYLGLKPGLTGLWQVTGRSSLSYRRRVAADVRYARTRSLSLDIRILLITIPAVLFGRGAC